MCIYPSNVNCKPTMYQALCTRLTTWCWANIDPVSVSTAAAAAKSLQSCPTLCDPTDGSPPGSTVPAMQETGVQSWVGKIPWRRKWQPTRVLAWRIPGTGEPGKLPSVGSHRVGHDWSDLAAAAACCFDYCSFVVYSEVWKSCTSRFFPFSQATLFLWQLWIFCSSK